MRKVIKVVDNEYIYTMTQLGKVEIKDVNTDKTLYSFSMDKREENGGFIVKGTDINLSCLNITAYGTLGLVIQETVYQEISNMMFLMEIKIKSELKRLGGIHETILNDDTKSVSIVFETLKQIKNELIETLPEIENLILYTVRIMQTKNQLEITI